MIEKILFSPIGRSDPINAGHDGAWIHSCRHYQPDLTVIYLSAEMLQLEKRKYIYSNTLKKLCQLINKDIILEKEERENLTEPHDFDERFFDDFEEIITKYHEQYPDAEIYLNISSGTTAMKSCLSVLYHLLPFKTKLIQVAGPHEEMGASRGERHTVSDDYDTDDSWENNLDNLPDAENRCILQIIKQQGIRLKLMQMKTLISHHEYAASLILTEDEDLKDSLPEELITALQAAVSRMQMDLFKAGMLFKETEYEDGKMIRTHFKELLYQGAEMLLTMEIDLQRDDVASCLRKLTPVLFTLIIGSIEKHGIDIMTLTDDSQMYLCKEKLEASYPDKARVLNGRLFSNSFHPDTAKMDSGTLLLILNEISNANETDRILIKDLRKIEKDIRNEIAHKPIKMTAEVFQSKAGCTIEEMVKKAKNTFEILSPALFGENYWKSYERMKDFILDKVAIQKK